MQDAINAWPRGYPEHYLQIAAIIKQHELEGFLGQIRATIAHAVDALPSHQTFLNQYYKSTPDS
jgi:hypothetical protein